LIRISRRCFAGTCFELGNAFTKNLHNDQFQVLENLDVLTVEEIDDIMEKAGDLDSDGRVNFEGMLWRASDTLSFTSYPPA